jgi:hypothetical protein
MRSERGVATSLRVRTLWPYIVGALLPVGMMAYYYSLFGVFNVVAAAGGADLRVLTLHRMASVFLSPQIGVLWYYPAAWLAVLIAWNRSERMVVALYCGSVVAVVALCSTTTNINSAQLSAPRYAIWFLAPLYVLPFLPTRSDRGQSADRSPRTIIFGSLVAVAMLVWLHTYHFIEGEWKAFYSVNRTQSRVAKLYALTHFDDDIEPLVENIQGKELTVPLSFDRIYVWNVSGSQSMWIISKRAWQKMTNVSVGSDDAGLRESAAVREVFHVTDSPTGLLQLSPKPGVEFRSHPYWGGYLLLWVPANVTSVVSTVGVSLAQ